MGRRYAGNARVSITRADDVNVLQKPIRGAHRQWRLSFETGRWVP